jgi:MFS family permease
LIGRRYILLSGSALVIAGMIIVGLAGRMDVAIGGMAIAGVGGAFAELVGAAGISEVVPVKSRGTYLGTTFIVVLPFGACSYYGSSL